MDPSGPSTDLEVPLDVTVGTIPLRSYFDAYSDAAAQAGYAPPAGPTPWGGPQPGPAFSDPRAPPMPMPIPSAPMMPPGAPPDARKHTNCSMLHVIWLPKFACYVYHNCTRYLNHQQFSPKCSFCFVLIMFILIGRVRTNSGGKRQA